MEKKMAVLTAAALALMAAPTRAQIGSGGEYVSGNVVDAKGYPLRNTFIAADGSFDTSDVDGKFGPGKKPILGIAGSLPAGRSRAQVSGSFLRIDLAGAGAPVRATLYRATGGAAGTSVLPSGSGALAVDLNALAGGASEGLFLLRLETGSIPLHFLLARTGSDSWTLAARSSSPSPAALPLRKASALPATVRISKPGYNTKNLPVPAGGKVGTVTLTADWLSPVVDAPFDLASFYAPSGWMGDYNKITVVADNGDNPRPGDLDQKNAKWTYTPPSSTDTGTVGWGAVAWQYPENNWGVKPGRKITGATRITFWAKGAKGGESVDFKTGDPFFDIPPEPGKYRDSFYGLNSLVLTADWKQYEIPFDPGAKLDQALTAFIWAMAPLDGLPETIYIDEVRFE
jgi:hypothetical protein